ncbi:hypothetical protein [Stenotrophomonas sp. JAG2]|uniref:hypothetical protein n=1 Tax=Stenotrophomonas sp. JAG2 TaxID=3229243 RepID=UPI0034E2E54D
MTRHIEQPASIQKISVKGALSRDVVAGLDGHSRLHLELLERSGWDGTGLELLPLIGDVVAHLTVEHSRTIDASVVQELEGLETLALEGGLKGTIDLSNLALQGLSLRTRPGRFNITGRSSLLRRIGGFVDSATMQACAAGGSIEAITLVKSAIDELPPAEQLLELKVLQLIDLKQIRTISSALQSTSLQYVRATSCRSLDVSTNAVSGQLKYIALNNIGTITSLDLFKASKDLQVVSLLGDTVVADGRIDEFVRSKHLRHLRITIKKCYDIALADVPVDTTTELRLVRELEALSGIHGGGVEEK